MSAYNTAHDRVLLNVPEIVRSTLFGNECLYEYLKEMFVSAERFADNRVSRNVETCFVFKELQIRISAQWPSIVTEDLRNVPQYIKANAGSVF